MTTLFSCDFTPSNKSHLKFPRATASDPVALRLVLVRLAVRLGYHSIRRCSSKVISKNSQPKSPALSTYGLSASRIRRGVHVSLAHAGSAHAVAMPINSGSHRLEVVPCFSCIVCCNLQASMVFALPTCLESSGGTYCRTMVEPANKARAWDLSVGAGVGAGVGGRGRGRGPQREHDDTTHVIE